MAGREGVRWRMLTDWRRVIKLRVFLGMVHSRFAVVFLLVEGWDRTFGGLDVVGDANAPVEGFDDSFVAALGAGVVEAC